jgi:hypothetical protein
VTRATSVAYDPGEVGDVTLTNRAVAVTVGDAIAAAAAASAATAAVEATSLFMATAYIGTRTVGVASLS